MDYPLQQFASIYMFWELVGLSSYLLIGFWFEKDSAADASKKAFLVKE
jgi:NADH-quinone oxidoreductase subunit L